MDGICVHGASILKVLIANSNYGRTLATPDSLKSTLLQAAAAESAVGETVKVLLDSHEQPWCSLGATEPRGEGHTGNVGSGGGVRGGYGSEQVGVVEAPDSRVAVLAH